MHIIRGIYNLKEMHSNSVISIGNFDGVHLGHQQLLKHTCKIGKKYNLLTVIIIFEPQPLEFLRKTNIPRRITSFREKVRYISLFNIDKILCIKFNSYFSRLSAEDFIINILINKLHVKYIIIGDNFKFGYQRKGNLEMLTKLGKKYQFNTIQVPAIYKNNIKISSTEIRKKILENNIQLASLLLGRPFSIYGKVIHGKAIGRTIGYPTANILLKKKFLLRSGVYAVKIQCFNGKNFMGISNIGNKVDDDNQQKKQRILEVHLFNININLYQKNIEVFFYKRIRNEKNFFSIKELTKQISKDIIIVKKYFKINY